ncbi:beta-lactamase/transpeptidase-like protein [Peniophora sp. CONT]|nr:beta-lactamase/transpeptidase-like protein [Peniophora sp. CONT]
MTSGFSSSAATKVLDAELLGHIETIFTTHEIPGLSIAVVHADSPAEFANWGIRNEDGDAMASDSLMPIASCSKAFLASAMGILFEDFAPGRKPLPEGLSRVDWDTPAAALLPDCEWKLHTEFETMSSSMTLRDMLSHRTGLHQYGLSHFLSYGEPGDVPATVLHRLRYQRPAFEPRTRYLYCNPMYMSAQHILDVQTGSYTDFVERRIFKPLGMSAMYSPDAAIVTGRAASGFTKHDRRALPFFINEDNHQLGAGPGGVIASAHDLVKWVRMLLHGGVNPETGEVIIPKAVFEAVTTAHVISDGVGTAEKSIVGYGLGWRRLSYHGHDVVYHSGGNNDVTTLIMFAPHDRVGLVVLMNQEGQTANFDIGWAILRKAFGILLGAPAKPSSGTSSRQEGRRTKTEPAPADLTGTYYSAGQGSPITFFDLSGRGPEAERVLSTFRTVSGELAPGDLYAVLPRTWCTHVRLVHLGDARFSLRYNWFFPEGHGKDKAPFALHAQDEECGIVQFVCEGDRVAGFGLTGTVEEETVLERRGGRLQDIADAWFDKI